MSQNSKEIKKDDIERHMNDMHAKASWKNMVSNRYNALQKINTQLLALTEKDFESSINSIESIILNIQKKIKIDENKNTAIKKSANELVRKTLDDKQ